MKDSVGEGESDKLDREERESEPVENGERERESLNERERACARGPLIFNVAENSDAVLLWCVSL